MPIELAELLHQPIKIADPGIGRIFLAIVAGISLVVVAVAGRPTRERYRRHRSTPSRGSS